MKVVWKLGPATVRQVYENLLERRKIAYTTVMTMMNILEQKGHLKKRQGDRAFVYASARPEKQVIRGMVREFVDRVFNGAAEPLLLHLVEDDQLSKEDLEEMRRSIRSSEGKS
jgi:predicted transcriptional regulator